MNYHGDSGRILGKETEDRFMALAAAIGWEPIWFKNTSGKFDVLLNVNNKWYKVQIKTAWMLKPTVGLFPGKRFKRISGKNCKVRYEPNEVDLFAVSVDGEFYMLPYSHVYYGGESGKVKVRINTLNDDKYKLSNILKSCKNGKYFVDDTIILG